MKKRLFHLMIFVMIICLFPQFVSAKIGYVSDLLLLTFRQGPSNSYAVTKTLRSGTSVSILDEKNGFYKVELQSKEIGWVDKKFIMFELPKTIIIDQLTQKNRTLENKISQLESTAGTLKGKILSLESDYSQKIESLEVSLEAALDEKKKVSNSLSGTQEKHNTLIRQSKDIQKIIKENKTLQEERATLSKELEILKTKNRNLFKTGMIKWFLSGVGVLLLGWIIGQSVSSKKRGSGSLLD